jgi:actin-related protein 9
MDAFLAFLEHVHSQLTTTYHNTPIMLMASPQWTRPDCEAIARYIFEKTKTPALCLIHSGIATQYGLKWPNMTVVDVGFEKVDVTCIYDGRVVSHKDVGGPDSPDDISGGEVFTRRLLALLKDQGFDYDMAEQLKKSPICEVLPYAPDKPELMELPVESAQGASASGAGDAPKIIEPTDDYGVNGDVNKEIEEDGVLDVANIVASGQTREFLAKKEREKAEKAKAGRKGKDKEGGAAAGDAAKPLRLPNSKRVRNVFHYEELVTEDVPVEPPAPAEQPMTDAPAPTAEGEAAAAAAPEEGSGDAPKPEATEETAKAENGDAPKPGEESQSQPQPADAAQQQEQQPQQQQQPTDAAQTTTPRTERVTRRVRRDIEVGLERFQFADRREIDRIATAIYRAVQGIEDMYMRPPCWENLVFVGNGARIRGLRDNIIQTLQARHIISPSTATIFSSELPSNIGTPSGTGSQTPTSSFAGGPPHQLPTSSNVNPLLQAATTASLNVPGAASSGGPGSTAGDAAAAAAASGGTSHHFHSQTPTTIKLAPLPTYLSEWTKHGFEEAMFLGAQVAARLAFCIHNLDAQGQEAQRMMSLSRVDYK